MLKIKFTLHFITVATIAGLMVGCSQGVRAPYVGTAAQQTVSGASIGGAIGSVGALGLGPGAIVGGAVGSVIGYDIQRRESQYLQKLDRIRSFHVDIYQEGDQIKFVLPGSVCFYDNSNKMKLQDGSERFLPLYLIADLIKDLPVDVIEVIGFAYDKERPKRNKALSYARAMAVMEKLQEHELSVNIIAARGEGALLPHEYNSNTTNDRVEIILNPILHLNLG